MNRLGVSPSDSVFVGDNPDSDIAGARGAMMKTIWNRNASWIEAKDADAVIDELNEIPLILETFNSC